MNRLFKKYPEGSNITILNTIYHYPRKDENEKWVNGAITLIAKDLDSGKKLISIIDNPTYEFYTVKPEYYPNIQNYYHKAYPIEWLTLHEVPYVNLNKDIAEFLDKKHDYYEDMKCRDWRSRVSLYHTDNRIVRSTMNISDFYRYKFAKMYQNKPFPLHKGYFDIEADAAKGVSEFPDMGEVPINSISFIDSFHKEVYLFMLEDKTNPQFYKLREEIKNDSSMFINDIWENINKAMNNDKSKLEKYKLQNLHFNFLFYNEDEEIKMLHELFMIMSNSEIDVLLAWNMKFDIPYIIARCMALGFNPATVLCHPAFKYKECEYFIDQIYKDDYHLRGDYAKISVPFVCLDQLTNFANRRKSVIGSFPNFKLDTIAFLTAGIRKLDYSHITRNIKELPKKNYRIFEIYNIIDTIAQECIEESEKDLDYLFALSLESNTRFSKLNKPSIVLYNEANKLYESLFGLIIGNNINAILKPIKEPYDGAYVSEPKMLSKDLMMEINGAKLPIFDNVADEDFSSMYPSEDINFNMSEPTQIGRIKIPKKIREDEDKLHKKAIAIQVMGKNKDKNFKPSEFNRGGAYAEDLATYNWLVFGHRWFGLENFKGLIDYITWYFTKFRYTDATIRDVYGNIITKDANCSKIPWYIDPSIIYGNDIIKKSKTPWKIQLPVTDHMEVDVSEYYENKQLF